MMYTKRPPPRSLDAVRRRLIHETEIALLYGLRFPGRHVRIPTIEVGKGAFRPEFAARFWREVLELADP